MIPAWGPPRSLSPLKSVRSASAPDLADPRLAPQPRRGPREPGDAALRGVPSHIGVEQGDVGTIRSSRNFPERACSANPTTS